MTYVLGRKGTDVYVVAEDLVEDMEVVGRLKGELLSPLPAHSQVRISSGHNTHIYSATSPRQSYIPATSPVQEQGSYIPPPHTVTRITKC